MRLVIALGGNALLKRGEPPEVGVQRRNVERVAPALAALARQHRIVLTHGNGPQVGLLALQAVACPTAAPYPLDVLGAESEGMIGYLLEQALAGELPEGRVATLLTQVEVDRDDPAFASPSKPIGPVYRESDARRVADLLGWSVARDGQGYRRVVPSPEPRRIVEMSTIRLLVDAGVVVVCAGGGGIPVVIDEHGVVVGIEAVVDKDLSSALLAIGLDADGLLLLTDVEFLCVGWDTPEARAVAGASPRALRGLDWAAGSMAPKVEGAARFVEATGRPAYIGRLDKAVEVLRGKSGTRISLEEDGIRLADA